MTHDISETPTAPVSRYYTAPDGLKLHVLDWSGPSDAIPVVCLPGLARTAADFSALATRLARTRRVLALDYRGRGLSRWDADWKNYSLAVENADILAVFTAMGVDRATIVGTSRGGLHAMLLSATRPTLLHAVVLNDIGPAIEARGMARIRGYVGKLPAPKSWADAADLARFTMGEQFSGLDAADFETYARLTFEEKKGVFSTRYDPALLKTLEGLDLSAPLPTMWPQFEGLRDIPTLVIRGANSDLLSAETVDEMARRHPSLEAYVVPGQGHAPLLLDTPSIERVAAFVEGN